jgi:hypothetical protein
MPWRAIQAIILKQYMEPVKKMLSEEFTMVLKEIVLIGMRGKRVICKYKPYHTGMLTQDQGHDTT